MSYFLTTTEDASARRRGGHPEEEAGGGHVQGQGERAAGRTQFERKNFAWYSTGWPLRILQILQN